VRDPFERWAADGTIRTGARRDRIATTYEPVLTTAVERIQSAEPSASVAVYGSVATGQALAPGSDVDLVAVGLPKPVAHAMSDDLTTRIVGLCREVATDAHPRAHLSDVTEAADGDRVFLRYYCVHLAGTEYRRRSWSDSETRADTPGIQQALADVVSHVVTAFADLIGLWP
jgi:predicted nucleotidyltransferase